MHTLTSRGGSKGYARLPVRPDDPTGLPAKIPADAYSGVLGGGPGTLSKFNRTSVSTHSTYLCRRTPFNMYACRRWSPPTPPLFTRPTLIVVRRSITSTPRPVRVSGGGFGPRVSRSSPGPPSSGVGLPPSRREFGFGLSLRGSTVVSLQGQGSLPFS